MGPRGEGESSQVKSQYSKGKERWADCCKKKKEWEEVNAHHGNSRTFPAETFLKRTEKKHSEALPFLCNQRMRKQKLKGDPF